MSFCKDCGKQHKGKKEEYIEEKEVMREPFPYDPAPSEDKKEYCAKCGGIVKSYIEKDKNQFQRFVSELKRMFGYKIQSQSYNESSGIGQIVVYQEDVKLPRGVQERQIGLVTHQKPFRFYASITSFGDSTFVIGINTKRIRFK